MTISSQVRTAGPYAGTGGVATYPFAFKVFQGSDLLVARTNPDGSLDNLVLSSDFTATLNADQDANPGGTITLLAGVLPVGYSLDLTSNLAVLQPTALTNQGGFFPKVIERALDRLTIIIQQLGFVNIKQSLRVPDVQGVAELPPAGQRANKVLSFDANGNPKASAPVSGSIIDFAITLLTGFGSTLIGYVASGLGAILRNIQDKLRESPSVKDYGALGNDAANDTDGFLKALAALPAGGGRIKVPPGKYRVNPDLIKLAAGQFLAGAWLGSSVLRSLSATGDIITVGGIAERQDDLGVSRLKFDPVVTRTGGRDVYVKNCYNSETSRLVHKRPFIGLELDSVVAYADQIRVDDAVAGTGVGILISGGNDHFVSNVMGKAEPGAQPQALIKMTASEASWIRDVDAIACGTGLMMVPDGAATVAWTWITNFAADQGNSHGILLAPTGGANIRGTHIALGWAGTNALDGLRIDTVGGNVDSTELIGFRSYNNGQNGALVSGGANFKMMGGSVGGNNTTGGTYYGVAVIGNHSGLTLAGVRSGNPAALPATQTAGILIDTGVEDVSVNDCDVRGNAGGVGMIDNSTTTDKTISGNAGYKTNTQGVATIAVGATAIAVNHGLAVTPGYDCISLTPVFGSPQQPYWVNSISSTQFSISLAAPAAVNPVNFQWSARVKGS